MDQEGDDTMAYLFAPLKIGGRQVKNRVVLPPMVCFGWAGDDGLASERHTRHYEARARGGAGLIILEATAVSREGRLADTQLGIWSDDHIPGLKAIADRCHKHGALVLVQIHHAGLNVPASVATKGVAPSDYDDGKRRARELTVEEIRGIRRQFIDAARRAHAAGLDGVELHGAHGYLLSQFASPRINRRTDEYGGRLEGRLRLAREIVEGIRDSLPGEFIVGCRMGSNEPDLDTSIAMARLLQAAGVDLLHVSTGMNGGTPLEVPEGFPFNWIVYGGVRVHEHVSVPVIAVNGIRAPEQAENLVAGGMADLVAVGRAQLADPDWAAAAMEGRTPAPCRACKPCSWFSDGTKCPRYQEGRD